MNQEDPALDPGDSLDEADRSALHQALIESQKDVEAGRLFDAEEVLKELGTL
jgi:predicted transcriptional regulator